MKTLNIFKSLNRLMSLILIAGLSTTVLACPKGTTLTGGTGPNHKGGKCVAVAKNQTSLNTAQPKSTTVKPSPVTPNATPSKSTSDRKTP